MEKNNYKPIVITLAGVGVIIALAIIAQPRSSQTATNNPQVQGQAVGGALQASETSYSFGTVSMAAGNVKHAFPLKNTGSQPIAISKIYTSCMCTTASLQAASGSFGPFGMPGHGFIPSINGAIAPGETAQVEVVFDPAAHGPAGVGRIDRLIYLEIPGSAPLQLAISANVTP